MDKGRVLGGEEGRTRTGTVGGFKNKPPAYFLSQLRFNISFYFSLFFYLCNIPLIHLLFRSLSYDDV